MQTSKQQRRIEPYADPAAGWVAFQNKTIEQDHRPVKRLVGPISGMNHFHCTRNILGGIQVKWTPKARWSAAAETLPPTAAQKSSSLAI